MTTPPKLVDLTKEDSNFILNEQSQKVASSRRPATNDRSLDDVNEVGSPFSTRLRKRSQLTVDTVTTVRMNEEQHISPQVSSKSACPSRDRFTEEQLQQKIDLFLGQLRSTLAEDVEVNAELLSMIIQSFASTFSVKVNQLVNLISQETGVVDMQVIRSKLLKLIV